MPGPLLLAYGQGEAILGTGGKPVKLDIQTVVRQVVADISDSKCEKCNKELTTLKTPCNTQM